MRKIVFHAALTFALLAGCAQTQPAESAMTENHRTAPGKCSACHLAPKEHSLAATQWETYLKNHKRRLRLSDEERTFLYDFLIGGPPPTTATRDGAETGKSTE
jgi:hypothetical protein